MLAAFFSVFPARFDELATDSDARSFLAGKYDQDPSRFLFAAQAAHGIGPSATKRSKTKNPTAPRARFREELWRDANKNGIPQNTGVCSVQNEQPGGTKMRRFGYFIP